MKNKIQYLKNKTGQIVGVYIPIEVWESLINANASELKQLKRKRGRKKKVDLPSHDLGSDFLPSRVDIYDEQIESAVRER
jgi:hypothetical protein